MTPAQPPEIKVPLTAFVKQVAYEAAAKALEDHLRKCPIQEIEARTRRIEMKLAWLLGMIAGSGLLGGAVGASLVGFLRS